MPQDPAMPASPWWIGSADSRLGVILVAVAEASDLRLLWLGDSLSALRQDLQRHYPRHAFSSDAQRTAPWLAAACARIDTPALATDAILLPPGTPFQWRVWRALQDIAPGSTRSYGELAASLGMPTAARAVAGACASNPIALLIPCHRVIRRDHQLGGYRWGEERKRRLLQWEAAAALTLPSAAGAEPGNGR